MQYRLTMYNYNPASVANQQKNQLITQIQGQKFNLNNLNTTKNNFYDMNGRKVKNTTKQSNVDINDENNDSKQELNSSSNLNNSNIMYKSNPKKASDLKQSIYNIYKHNNNNLSFNVTNSPQKLSNNSFVN